MKLSKRNPVEASHPERLYYNVVYDILYNYVGSTRVLQDLFYGRMDKNLLGTQLIVDNGLRIELDIESARKLSINIILEPNGQTNQER